MDLTLSPNHVAFRQAIREFIALYGDRAEGVIPGQRPGPKQIAWQALLLEHGYAGRFVPLEYGGYGAPYDIMEQRLIVEEFSRAAIPAGIGNQGISMLVPTLLELGTEQQKRDYIAPTLRGEMVWCQGYSEPNAGSDLAALQTRGVEDGENFIVNGQKIWTSTAHEADMIFCLVRTEPHAPKHEGISYLLFSMDDPGIDIRPLKTMSGRAEFNEVFFTDVRVPRIQMLGERGDGWRVANATLQHERAYLANSALLSQRYAELSQLIKENQRNGQAITTSQALQERLMQLQSRLLALKCHDLRLLTHSMKGTDPGIAGLITKLYGTETRYQVDVLALDAQGELGLLNQSDPRVRDGGVWFEREALDLGLIIGGGTAQIQKNIIAERGLGMPREPKPVNKEG